VQKVIVVAASLLVVVASAFGQESRRSNAVSVFVTDMSLGSAGSSGTKFDSVYGASFDRMFSDRFSAEVSVSSQKARRVVRTATSGSMPSYGVVTTRLVPIDANLSYHFLTNGHWKPYIGAGLRYVKDSFHGHGFMFEYVDTIQTVDPEVSGGLVYQFNPVFGLRFDAKQVLGSNRSTVADPELKASVGLSLRF
jgi:outer membrane protein W